MRNLQQKLYLALAIIAIVFFTLTIRGNVGNPTPEQIDKSLNHNGQAFETSQERSRYALILSMYYDHAFSIDNYASMGTPDIGFIKGHFFSFFPPGASVLALPLFVVGQQLGIAQLAVFSITTLFSFFTMLLIIRFCYQLKLHWSICLLAAISFGFATNAWGYSVTLYAHVISSFFILLGLYSLLFMKNWRGALFFCLCYRFGG